MVRLLAYIHLISFTSIVAGQIETVTLGPKEDYFGEFPTLPTPASDEVIAIKQDGRAYIIAGDDRAARIKKVHEDCNGTIDEECFNAMAQAWGYGHDGDPKGLSKRMIGLDDLAAGASGSQLAVAICLFFSYDCERKMTAVQLPRITPSPTVVYKASSAELTVVATPAPLPAPAEAPAVINNVDGSVEITIPADLLDATHEAMERIVCKRSSRLLRRQEGEEAWRECVKMASQSIAREADLGAFLQRYRGVRVINNNPAWPDIGFPLPAGFQGLPAELNNIADQLSFFGGGAEEARRDVAGLSLLVSYAQIGAGIEVREKFTIPAEKLNREKEEDPEKCEEPHKEGMWFCDQECGGSLGSLLVKKGSYKCKGRNNDDKRKGCPCRIPHPGSQYTYEGLTVEPMNRLITGGTKPPAARPKDSKTCHKQDPERTKDLKNWKFVRQDILDTNIKDGICGPDWKDPGQDGLRVEYNIPKSQPVDSWDHDVPSWSHVAFHIGAGAKKEDCERILMEISSGCDYDSRPLEQNMNQFNFKWGGEIIENGIKWAIEPLRERLDLGLAHKKLWKCYIRENGLFSNNKGNNGKNLDDEARMALAMCVHQMHQNGAEGRDDIDCGGLMKTGMRRKNFHSREDCADFIWSCLTYGIANGEAREAEYAVGLARCNTSIRFGK